MSITREEVIAKILAKRAEREGVEQENKPAMTKEQAIQNILDRRKERESKESTASKVFKHMIAGPAAIAEPVSQIATGLVAKPVSELAGLGSMLGSMAGLTDELPTDVRDRVADALTYQPKTEVGASEYNPINAITNAIGSAVEYGAEGISQIGGDEDQGAAERATRSAVKEALAQAAGFVGVKGGKVAAGPLDDLAQAKKVARETEAALKSPEDKIVTAAQESGLIVPKENLSPTYIKNRDQAAALAREEIGLTPDTPLTEHFLGKDSEKRKELNKKYDNAVRAGYGIGVKKITDPYVPDSGPINKYAIVKTGLEISENVRNKLTEHLDELKAELEYSPNIYAGNKAIIQEIDDILSKKHIDPVLTMQTIGRLRSSTSRAMKNGSVDDATFDRAMARKDIANSLEQVFSDHFEKLGDKKLLNEFHDARTKLAQIHFIDAITSPSGKIDLGKLKRIGDKLPLTGNLKIVYEALADNPEMLVKGKRPSNVPDVPIIGERNNAGMRRLFRSLIPFVSDAQKKVPNRGRAGVVEALAGASSKAAPITGKVSGVIVPSQASEEARQEASRRKIAEILLRSGVR